MCRFGFIDMMHCESHHRVDYYTAQHTCMVFSSQPSKPKQSISPTYIHLIYTFLFFLDFEVKISPSFQHFRFSHNSDESSSPTTIKHHHTLFLPRKVDYYQKEPSNFNLFSLMYHKKFSVKIKIIYNILQNISCNIDLTGAR